MTATLTPEARRNVALFQSGSVDDFKVKFKRKRKSDGTQSLQVSDYPVFRSGTFRDSMGMQHTWEPLHLDQMVAHHNLLAERGIFKDVPVKRGHGALFGDPIDNLIGYTTSLRTQTRKNPVDGEEYTYLFADFEILDPDAQSKIASGLWRNRSAEIGPYVTNNESEFFPVFYGFAFVDMPAVEGLNEYAKQPGVGNKFSICFEDMKEAPEVGTTESTEGTPAEGQPETPTTETPAPPVEPVTSETEEVEEENEGEEETVETPVPVGAHSRTVSPHQFKIGGGSTTDYAAVQRHIDSLEEFQKETREQNRKDFVSSLAKENKITAPQVDKLEPFVLGLNDTQYTAWKSSWDDAQTIPLFGNHATGGSQGGETDKKSARIEVLEGVVKHQRDSGMPQDKLEQLPSYKELQQLKAEQ